MFGYINSLLNSSLTVHTNAADFNVLILCIDSTKFAVYNRFLSIFRVLYILYIYIFIYWIDQKFFWFLSKNKRHIFSFSQRIYWTMYSPFCSTVFCHFSENFKIPSSQNVLSFWAKNCFKYLLQSSRKLKLFPLREFCKDLNKSKSEGAVFAEYSEWVRTSQPNWNRFAWLSKKHVILNYPHERFCSSCWLIQDAFHWVMLQLVSLVAVLVGINCLHFQEELMIEDSLSNPPYMQHHLLWMKTSFLCGWRWFISFVPWSFLLHIIVQYPLFILHTICF